MIYTFSFTLPQSIWTIYRWEEKDNQLLPKGPSHPTFSSELRSTTRSNLTTQMPNSQISPKSLAKCGKKQTLTPRIDSKTNTQRTRNSQSRIKKKEPGETLKVTKDNRKPMKKNPLVDVANLQAKRKLLLQESSPRLNWLSSKPKRRQERKGRKWHPKESKLHLVDEDHVDLIQMDF